MLTLAWAAPASAQPQLDKAFAPATVGLGDTTTLTFTIANDDLAAKRWSFTDTLSAGLQVASQSITTDCPATTVRAPLGASSIAAAGTLGAGQASCTISVKLMATHVGTLVNGASNLTAISGLLAPALPASLDCRAPDPATGDLGDVFSSCPFQDDPPAFDFTIKQAWQTADSAVSTYQTPVIGDLYDRGKAAVVIGSSDTITGGTVHEGRLARNLLVQDGATGALLHKIVTPRYAWTSHAAATIADVDGDGDGEIIFRAASHSQGQVDADAAGVPTGADVAGRLVAYEFDEDADEWVVMWVSDKRYDHVPDVGATAGARGGHGVGVADFNGDGVPEVYVGNQVFNARTGVRLAAAPATAPSGCAFRTGATFCMWGQVAAADFDGDGKLELAAGNAIYKIDIESTTDEGENTISIWRQADPSNTNVRDGYTAIADMDLDGTPDVVVSGRLGTESSATVVYAWSGATGAILGIRNGNQMVGSNGSRGGPPMVGDIDGDGRPEIVVVTTNRLRAFQVIPGAATVAAGLQEEWTLTTLDGSGSTSMSMFDFNNDGRQEIVYRDEQNIRILDGGPTPANPTTRNRTTFQCASGTGMETPVIADIDGSREARIVVTCQSASDSLVGDVRAYETASFPWANTRPVWNQQSYFVAHVNDDLTIPAQQFEHWTVFDDPHERCSSGANRPLNAFQQQVTDLDGASGCPVECGVADIVVEKTSDPPSGSAVHPGQTIRYEIAISNPSEWDGYGIEAVDDLSDILDDATLTAGPTVSPGTGGTVSIVGDELRFQGDVFSNDTVIVSYEVTVNALDALPAGDGRLRNSVVAEFSDCVEDGDCATEHTVGAIAKQAQPRTVTAGDGEVTYTYVLSGPAFASQHVAFSDVLPDGMTYVADSVSVWPPFGIVNAYAGTDTLTVEGGIASVPTTITATASVAADAGCFATLDNQAVAVLNGLGGSEIRSDDPDSVPLGDPTSVAVECVSDLSLVKSGPPVVATGGEIEWRIQVSNGGPSASPGATVTDELPAGVSNAATSTPGCAIAGGTLTCDVGPLAVGATHEIIVTADAPATQETCVTNTATVVGDAADPDSADVTDSTTSCTPPAADLRLSKTAAAVVEPGGEITWTLTVTNDGPDPSTGSVVTDELPAGVSNAVTSTPGCAIAGGTLTCDVGPLAVDATHEIVVTADAPATPATCVTNAASVDGEQVDPVPGNDAAEVETCTSDPVADLSIQKSGPGVVDPEAEVSWTIVVTNTGPDRSTGSSVTDVLPAGVSKAATSTPGCAIAGGTLTCAVGPLDVGATHEIEVTADAPATSSTCFRNTATVAGIQPDPDNADDSATARTCTSPAGDLSIAKTAAAEVEPGGRIAWRVTVVNDGPDTHPGATVTDTLPAGVTDASSDSPGCTIMAGEVTCVVGALPAGARVDFEISADAPGAFSTCVTNVAVLSGEADPDLSNNEASAETCTRAPESDLAIAKTGPATIAPGATMTWTLTVTVAGGDPSPGATVTDVVPPAYTNVASATPGCDVVGNVVTCLVGALDLDDSAVIEITATAPAASSRCVTNTATVAGAATDPVPQNDSASRSTCTDPRADLSLQKSAALEVEPGGQIEWTLAVTNHGPDLSTGSTVTDELPAGVSNAATSTPGCAIAGGTLTCDVGALAVGATREIVVTADAPTAFSACVVNDAAVAGDEVDPDPSDNTASVETCTRAQRADLGIEKSGPGSVLPGGEIEWTLTVTNHGEDPSSGSTITDTLPADVRDPTSATPGCAIVDGTLTCDVGPLGVGEHHVVTVSATAPAGEGACVVNAVSVAGDEADPVAENDSTTAETCTYVPEADLAIEKSAPASVLPGAQIAWTLTVTNTGPDPSTGSSVTDTLPEGVSDAATTTPGCTIEAGVVTCDLGPLAVGASHVVSLTATAPSTDATCVINAAAVVGHERDPEAGNDSDAAQTCTAAAPDPGPGPSPDPGPGPSPGPQSDPSLDPSAGPSLSAPRGPNAKPVGARVSIAKRVGSSKAHRGSVADYRIAVRNRGDAPARGLTVCDRPPAALRILRATGARRSKDGLVCWQVKQLAPGAVHRFRVTAKVRLAAPLGVLRNRAYVRGLNVRSATTRADVRVLRTVGACAAGAARVAC